MSNKKLFLLDGHALVYRAHYAFIARPLINSKGWNTSAVAGFTRTLVDLINNQHPTHIAVSFDLSGPTFRHEMYEPYKANREAQPEDITFALPYVHKLVEAFKIPVVTMEGYEADDVIGTLAKQAEKEGFDVYMVTPDKDYAQLVSDHIYIYKPGRQGNEVEIMGRKEVCEKWEIEKVEQVIDVLGLQGDSVDNIPGIPGIGPKTAVKLLADFESVEGVIANSDKLKGKQKERVEEFAEQAILSKQLATIDINAPVKFDAKQFELEPYDQEALEELFKELEFRTLAKSILGNQDAPAAPAASNHGSQGSLFSESEGKVDSSTPAAHSVADHNIHDTPHTYQLVSSEEEMKNLATLLASQKEFCFDTETTDIDANLAKLVGIAFSIKEHEAYYVPVPADEKEVKKILDVFGPILENENIIKIGQNIKYDALVLKWHGIELKGAFKDTMLYHYLLEPSLRHNMDYLAETYLKYQPVSIETLIGKRGKNQLSMRDVDVAQVAEYAGEDADITLQLKNYFEPLLEKEGLLNLYDTMEGPLVKVLVDLEHSGVNLDVPFLEEYSVALGEKIDKIEKEIHEEAGVKFNIASPKQIGDILFDNMKIPYRWRKTKTGQYSTDEAKLSELAAEYPFVEKILEYRSLTKLKSTYVDALPKMVNPYSKRIHSSFNQALAATGRLSSNNPNLQNIPIRTEEGREIRKAFIPRNDDYILLAADYSQIELRLIAEISGDEAMLEAFASGQDIHRATAARVYGVPFDEVTSDQRRNAKTVNFSIIYGAGATNLSQQLNIKRSEAGDLIKQYFAQYQGLKGYMDKTVEDARKHGYVKTLLGRRRYLRDINSRNNLDRSNAERVAINTPIQGSAADMIKLAMINIHKALKDGGYKTEMILQVHDELVFDVYKPELEEVRPMILELMKNAIPGLKVPILVEAGVGKHWLEAH
ncbi:MAG: DNA polymerase I [Saprospiraceae bacterium]|nr:DNA polymerase I [Saprospiraceae bacterium]